MTCVYDKPYVTLIPYHPVNIVKASVAYVVGVHLQKHAKGTKL